MQQLPSDFLQALAGHDEVLVTSRETGQRGTVPMWFVIAPPGVVYLFSFAFSEKVRRWQQDGYLVNVWTVDDPHILHALGAMHVDAVITNDPARTRQILESRV